MLIPSFCIFLFIGTFKLTDSLPDLGAYIDAFQEVSKKTWTQLYNDGFQVELKAEVGWVFLSKVIAEISNSTILFFFVTSSIILYGHYVTIKRYAPVPYIYVAVILFFTGTYLQSLFVLRQHTAIAICLLSIPYILKQDLIKYLIVCCCAFLIHQSSLIWVPVYFLFSIKSERKLIYSILAFSAIIIVSYSILLPFITIYLDGYAAWVEKDDENGTKITESIMIGYVLLSRLYATKKNFLKNENKLFSIIITLAFFFSLAGVGFPQSGRLNMYYTRLVYIIIPQSIILLRSGMPRTLFGWIPVAMYIAVWAIHAFDADVDYNGYKFIWE